MMLKWWRIASKWYTLSSNSNGLPMRDTNGDAIQEVSWWMILNSASSASNISLGSCLISEGQLSDGNNTLVLTRLLSWSLSPGTQPRALLTWMAFKYTIYWTACGRKKIVSRKISQMNNLQVWCMLLQIISLTRLCVGCSIFTRNFTSIPLQLSFNSTSGNGTFPLNWSSNSGGMASFVPESIVETSFSNSWRATEII